MYMQKKKTHLFCIKVLMENVFSPLISNYSSEYSCAATPQIRQTGNRLSGLAETVYASLLAQCFV